MADETTRLILDIVGRDRGGSRSIRNVADAADDASDSVRRLDKDTDRAGKSLVDLGDDADNLSVEIDRTHKSVIDLAREIRKDPGDSGLLRQFNREQSKLRRLRRVKDLLPGEDDGRDAGDRVGRAFRTTLFARVSTAGVPAGATLARSIGTSFGGLPPAAQAAIGASIIAAVALVGPAIGATVSGAVVGALGGGAIAGGVLLAARDQRVKAAGTELGHNVLSGLESASKVMVEPVLRSIDIIRRGFNNDLLPGIRKAFATTAPFVDDLAQGVVDLARNALPGFNKLLERSGRILQLIGRELGQLGSTFDQFFDDISKNAEGNELALQAFFDGVERAVTVLGKILQAGGFAFEQFSKVINLATGNLGGFIDLHVRNSKDLAKSNDEAAAGFDRWRESVERAEPPIGSLVNTMGPAIERNKILGQTLYGAADAAGSLAKALDILNGDALDAAEAEIRYQEAIDDAEASLREHGRTTNTDTAAGRANKQALLDVAKAAQAQADADYRAKAATGDLTGAQRAANATLQAGRAKFIELAQKMGYSRSEAIKLADKLYALPNRNIAVNVPTAPALNNVKKIQRAINNIHGKTVGIHVSGPGGSGTQIAGAAKGEYITGPGPKGKDSVLRAVAPGEYIVRPEDVDAAGGKAGFESFLDSLHVRPTAGRFRPSFAPAAPVVNVVVAAGGSATDMDRALLTWLSQAINRQRIKLVVTNNRVAVG